MIKIPDVGRKPKGRITKNITLPPDVAKAAQVYADKHGETVSDIIEALLRALLGMPKEEIPADAAARKVSAKPGRPSKPKK